MLVVQKIDLSTSCLRTSTEDQNTTYVFYTGGIAGISDNPSSKTDTESLDRSPNEIKLHGD